MPTPQPSRMTSPGYGLENTESPPGVRFPWQRVEEIIAAARNYWIGSTKPDGSPHAAPVWGVWLNGVLYFSTGKQSRKGRNLALNPSVSVHVEGPGREVVIVEGMAAEVSDASVLRPIWDVYKKKYEWEIEGYPFYAVRPAVAFSFEEDLGDTATRWTFQGS